MTSWKACLLSVLALVALATLPRPASAQTATCDALSGAQRALALDLLKSQHPYNCCDKTIWDCLHSKQVCRLATRIANDVCRRAKAEQSKAAITRELSRRATSMTGRKYSINLSGEPRLGDGGPRSRSWPTCAPAAHTAHVSRLRRTGASPRAGSRAR